MPKGRKRSPQDSIDSILLAISRREQIDPGTMSHYIDRLDEEWASGAREKVLHLLRTNDPAAHSAAVLILSELATDFDLEALEDLVADPTVSDLAKLSLAPILKELNSEMADEGLIEYLNDPEAAMQQMQVRLLELIGKSELGVESVLEDVLSMPLEKRLGFINWLGNSYDPRAANLLIPLLENQSGKVVEAAIDALEGLGSITAHQAIPALNYLVAHTSNRQVKQHARAALGRLTMQSAPGTEEAALAEAQHQELEFYDARVSYVDGVGAQMIMLAWKRPDGLLKGVNILYQDQWGIKDCYGTDEMQSERWLALVSEIGNKGFGNFQVPLDYARAVIAEAYAASKRTRHKLPVAYTIWRPLIEGEELLKKDAASALTKLEPVELTPEVLRLVQLGNTLYSLPEFISWMFEPVERIQPYVDRYWLKRNSDIFSSSRAGQGRKGRHAQRKQQARADLEAIVSEAIEALIDDNWRALYESRLLRQGALFRFAHRDEDASLVQAVASALHPGCALPAPEQPFLRAMMRYSIEQGPLRALAEALESGRLAAFPADLFPNM